MGPIAKWLVPPACCAMLVAAGCGSDDPEKRKEKAYIPAQPSPGQDTTAAPKQRLTVDMKDIRFSPENVAVSAGGTITWTNEDRVIHNVTYRAGTGSTWGSGDVAPKKTYRRSFDEDGLLSYLCTIHANMTGEIRVVE